MRSWWTIAGRPDRVANVDSRSSRKCPADSDMAAAPREVHSCKGARDHSRRTPWLRKGPRRAGSQEDLADDAAVDVGQAAVDAVVAEGQSGVVDPQQVQRGGVEVVAVGRVLDGPVRPLVAGPARDAPLNAAAGQP